MYKVFDSNFNIKFHPRAEQSPIPALNKSQKNIGIDKLLPQKILIKKLTHLRIIQYSLK